MQRLDCSHWLLCISSLLIKIKCNNLAVFISQLLTITNNACKSFHHAELYFVDFGKEKQTQPLSHKETVNKIVHLTCKSLNTLPSQYLLTPLADIIVCKHKASQEYFYSCFWNFHQHFHLLLKILNEDSAEKRTRNKMYHIFCVMYTLRTIYNTFSI